MRSFIDLDRTLGSQPRRLGVALARVDTGRGREATYRDQVPELLRVLAATTRVVSIIASSAIEGVDVDLQRVTRLVAPGGEPGRLRNRNEREFAGYRDAMDEIIQAAEHEPFSMPYVLHLHRLLFEHTDGRGGWLKSDQNLIVSYAGGRRQTLFTPPSPKETETLLPELFDRYRIAVAEQAAHPILLLGLLILDFLVIHPVADGNGRVARLMTVHGLLRESYQVARYVSIEQRMYDTRDGYYAALMASQRGWHEGTHDPWPWLTYLVEILAEAYETLEDRVTMQRQRTGSKQEQVRTWVLDHAPVRFRLADVRRALPGISDGTIRLVLGRLKQERRIATDPEDRVGPTAAWLRLV
ncbi:MAG: Fic family protein [Chloroflexi bacterium]|nr:Fic family protein [Chloroflexota bacterium]